MTSWIARVVDWNMRLMFLLEGPAGTAITFAAVTQSWLFAHHPVLSGVFIPLGVLWMLVGWVMTLQAIVGWDDG